MPLVLRFPLRVTFAQRPTVGTALIFAVLVVAMGVGSARATDAAGMGVGHAGTLRVAFFADTGYATLSRDDRSDLSAYQDTSLPRPARVLMLIRAEGADLAVHGGDLGYVESGVAVPERWDRMVTQILGADFPLFVSGGNHDQRHWYEAPPSGRFAGLGYSDVLRRRYEAVMASPFGADLRCSFPSGIEDIGQRATCTYKNILTVITVGLGRGNGVMPTAVGSPDNAYESYLQSALAESRTPWTVCNWHFNQRLFQTGTKRDQAGWKPYEYCRQAGALIATGHEHSYSRTHLMSRFSQAAEIGDIVSRDSDLTIDEDRTIAWVSGLGGKGILPTTHLAANPWWAATVNLDNQPEVDGGGVLFCDFSLSSDSRAECFFKTIDGAVKDRFRLVSQVNGASGTFGGVVPHATCLGHTATIVGTAGPDTLVGTKGADVIVGRGGDDRIYGIGGDDIICGRGGNDIISGGAGSDQIVGGRGDDVLYGRRGDDIINGGRGRDRLIGGTGRDECDGGGGVDHAESCAVVMSAKSSSPE